jgi:DNA-binding transcriptional MerR regulator
MSNTHWKIGELAKRTGVSIRTLHHYDEIGLLSPSHRTESGHRLYGREEVVRLQQVLSLRQLGFSLDEVRDALDRPDFDVRRVIELHVARLRQEIAMQQGLCERLEAIAARHPTASTEDFIQAIEVMTMFEKYYSKEQLDTLAKRREQLGEARMAEVQEEWPRLIAEVRAEMQRGTDPKEPRVQALAKKWMDLIHEFTGGDAGIEQSVRNMYRNEPGFAAERGLDAGISEYIRKAIE